MRTRANVAVLLVAVLAAVALALRAGGGGPSGAPQRVASGGDQVGGEAPRAPQALPAPSTAGSSTSSSTTLSVDNEADEDFTPAKRGAWARLSDPGRSDLGPELARSLARLGTAVLRADLTGEGRDVFGDYWAGDQRGPCCRRLEVHAAGASRQPGAEGVARVTVVWSADPVAGAERLVERTTVVHLALRDGRWVPIHPWEVPG